MLYEKILSVLLCLILSFAFPALFTSAAPAEGDYDINAYPYTSYSYSPSRAVNYASTFSNSPNSYFYYVSNNDCTNFVSQCVAYGFGDTTSFNSSTSYRMHNNGSATSGWFGGSGGGSSPWESVTAHWNYMVSSKTNLSGPRVSRIDHDLLAPGDVMQLDFENDGVYNHTVICVSSGSPLLFAQHTNNGIRNYEGYIGVIPTRCYRPTSFRKY